MTPELKVLELLGSGAEIRLTGGRVGECRDCCESF